MKKCFYFFLVTNMFSMFQERTLTTGNKVNYLESWIPVLQNLNNILLNSICFLIYHKIFYKCEAKIWEASYLNSETCSSLSIKKLSKIKTLLIWLVEILSAPDEQPLPVLISLLKSVYFNFCLSLFHCQAHPHNFVHHFFPVKPIIRSYKDLLQTRVLKSDSHLPEKKMLLFASMIALQKWWKMLFYLKALFVLKIYKFLSWLFGHVQKTPWLQR